MGSLDISWPAAAVAIAVCASVFGIAARNMVNRSDCDKRHEKVGDSQHELEVATTELREQVKTLFSNTERLGKLIDRQSDMIVKFEDIIRRNQD
jgi:TolA-binding protein